MKGSGWCWFHNPTAADERAAGRRLGGSARSNRARARKELPAEPLTNGELHAYLSLAFRQTLVKKLDPGVFSSLASGAKVIAELSKVVELDEALADAKRQIVDLTTRRSAS